MYKLLVVDDEPTVRNGLRNYMNWEKYGIEFSGEADDGDTALEAVERLMPDIVLTDVRMPTMDGITLSKEIRRRYPRIKIVFVSGHDDSEYMKSAMKVSAVDYIFKPVNLQELCSVIERVVAELKTEHTERKMTLDMQKKLRESMPLLREKFLMSLISDKVSQPERIHERVSFLDLQLPPAASFWVIVISLDNLADIRETRSEQDWQLLCYAVQNVCQELADHYLNGFIFEYRGEFVGILYEDTSEASVGEDCHNAHAIGNSEEQLFLLASDIRDNLKLLLKIGATIGIGERVSDLTGLTQSYAQATEAVARKWYLGKNQIITMDSLEPSDENYYKFDYAKSSEFVSILKGADTTQLLEILGELFTKLSLNRRDGLKYCRNVAMQIMLLAKQLLLELNVQVNELEEEEALHVDRLFKMETVDELRHFLETILVSVCHKISEKRSGRANNLVGRVHAIIERRYSDNALTVSEIGKEVYLTDTYVSLLFKQETGKTVNEYLTNYRIERAKEMLKDPSQKLYDICFAVGYADPSYFSKLFKKITGFTPSSYRDIQQPGK